MAISLSQLTYLCCLCINKFVWIINDAITKHVRLAITLFGSWHLTSWHYWVLSFCYLQSLQQNEKTAASYNMLPLRKVSCFLNLVMLAGQNKCCLASDKPFPYTAHFQMVPGKYLKPAYINNGIQPCWIYVIPIKVGYLLKAILTEFHIH